MVMKKNLSLIFVLLSLLANIQIGFTHDIEHQYHDDVHHDDVHHDDVHHDDVHHDDVHHDDVHYDDVHYDDVHSQNLIECEDCTFVVTDHSAKTTNLSSGFDFSLDQSYQIIDNYLARDSFSLGLVAYQSRAP